MGTLIENPHLQECLKKLDLTINPHTVAACRLSKWDELRIGSVRPEGTVVGFCPSKSGNHIILAVFYDESKEGEDDALTTVECRL